MRIAAIVSVMLCLAAANAAADEVYEPHALLYYQVSFAGSAKDRKSSFGLRLDQTYHARNEAPDFRQLIARPAIAEWRLDSDGAYTLNIAGTDLRRAYHVLRADGEGTAPETPAAGESTAANDPATAEAKEGGKEGDKEAKKETKEGEDRSLGDYLDEAPTGYLIGIALGVVLLTGLGD